MTISKSLFSCNSDDYETPDYLYDLLNSVFDFHLDPCARMSSEAQKRIHTKIRFTKEDDGLCKSWINYSTFVNPPYSKISTWIDKCISEYDHRIKTYVLTKLPEHIPSPIILLVPARTDTKWFHTLVGYPYTKVIFIKGRLKFSNRKSSAPFPSCIAVISSTAFFDKLFENAGAEHNHRLTIIPAWTLDIRKGLTAYTKKRQEYTLT